MKKLALTLFVLALTVTTITMDKTFAAQKKKTPSQSAIQSAVVKYRNGNYVGSMQDLEDTLAKNPNNYYAKYYLALCHTRLGHKDKAKPLYEEVVNSNSNDALVYYSQKAIDCLDNPNGEKCKPVGTSQTPDDITKFIQSGKQIHPAAMDRIINTRMERSLEKEEYAKKQNLNRKSDNSIPTNEEIAQALNTLSKAGLNPYSANPYMTLMNNQSGYNPYIYSALLQNNNPNISSMLLYNQMLGSGNLF